MNKNEGRRGGFSRLADKIEKGLPTLAAVAAASLLLTAVCAVAAFATAILPDSEGAQKIIVPDVVGTSLDEIRLDENIFSVSVEYVLREELGQGTVVEQYPPAGDTRKVVAGERPCLVRLKVSRGRETVMLPYLRGRDAESAAAMLEELGLVGEIVRIPVVRLPEGQVVRTLPEAYCDVPLGEVVRIFAVGQTAEGVCIPSLIGLTETEARRRIEASGLEAGACRYVAAEAVAGRVVDQSLAFGATAPAGTRIYLTVSKGPRA